MPLSYIKGVQFVSHRAVGLHLLPQTTTTLRIVLKCGREFFLRVNMQHFLFTLSKNLNFTVRLTKILVIVCLIITILMGAQPIICGGL